MAGMREEDLIATVAEASREYAYNFGMDHLDSAWILSSFDIWERNPFYTGKPVPHPEDDYGEY